MLELLGVQPEQIFAVLYNLVMGAVSVPVVDWLKVVLAKLPFIPSETSAKISGWFTPVVASVVGLAFVYVGNWFGLHVFANPNFGNSLVVALGLNGTLAAMFFEWLKNRKAQKNVINDGKV